MPELYHVTKKFETFLYADSASEALARVEKELVESDTWNGVEAECLFRYEPPERAAEILQVRRERRAAGSDVR